MRYVEGISLSELMLQEGMLPVDRVLTIFSQVCDALAHSHMKGIVHRDIKPGNIIIAKTEAGNDLVQLVDFGIARCIFDEQSQTQALTRAIDVLGSPRYMSPEQLIGEQVTEQSDIYSLGCVLYEMLTGKPPFTEENPLKLILQHLGQEPDLSIVPVQFRSILDSCLAKTPGERPKEIGTLIGRLAVCESAPVVTPLPSDLTHYVIGSLLILLPWKAFADYPNDILCYGLLLSLIWLYLKALNRTNAGKSTAYCKMEVTLLFASAATLLLSGVSRAGISGLAATLSPGFAILFCWLLSKQKVFDYCVNFGNKSLFPKTVFSLSQRIENRLLKIISKVALAAIAFGFGFFCVREFFALFSSLDFGVYFVTTFLCSLIANPIIIVACTCVGMLMIDVSYFQCSVGASLKRIYKLFGTCFVAGVLGGSIFLASVWGPGIGQLARQAMIRKFPRIVALSTRQRVMMEALNYGDSLYGNDAKFFAVKSMHSSEDMPQSELKLCSQILGSKQCEPWTKAQTVSWKLAADRSISATEKIAEINQALALLEGLTVQKRSDIFRVLFPYTLEPYPGDLALYYGEMAITLKDAGTVKRAIAIAENGKELSGRTLERVNDLKLALASMEQNKAQSH